MVNQTSLRAFFHAPLHLKVPISFFSPESNYHPKKTFKKIVMDKMAFFIVISRKFLEMNILPYTWSVGQQAKLESMCCKNSLKLQSPEPHVTLDY